MARGYPDYEGNKVGLYLKPEWAAFEAEDQDFEAGGGVAWGGLISVVYLVPLGRTLYLTYVSCISWSTAAIDADNNHLCYVGLADLTDGRTLGRIGGNGGAGLVFSKPQVFPAGHQMRCQVRNTANHACNVGVTCGGYEI